MFGIVHIDEIDYHYASHIAESQLTGYLLGSYLIDFEGVLLLVGGLCPDAAIDIYDVQGFCGFDDQIGSLLHGDYLAEGALDLARDLEMVEDCLFAFVELYDFLLLGRYLADIRTDFFADSLVVYVNVRELIVEKIPQYGNGLVVFGEQEPYALGVAQTLPGAFPFLNQGPEFAYQHCRVFVFCGGTDYGSVILGKNAAHECFKPLFLFFRRDFLGHAHFLGEREQYYVASCQ